MIELKAPKIELLPHFVDALPLQRVITANGGVMIESFTKPAAFGSAPGLRYRIPL